MEQKRNLDKEDIYKILRKSYIPTDCQREIMWYLEKRESEPVFKLIHMFNYGKMIGKQEERAKRRTKIKRGM